MEKKIRTKQTSSMEKTAKIRHHIYANNSEGIKHNLQKKILYKTNTVCGKDSAK